MKFIPKRPKLIGPQKSISNKHIRKRLELSCTECECCGTMWHFKGKKRKGFVVQANIGGRAMAVRKAAWMAFFPEREVIDGMRITSRCENPFCINPELLVQITPGELLEKQYMDGIRSKAKAVAHLMKYSRENAKLDEYAVILIRNENRKGTEAAHEYGINPSHYNAIQRGSRRAPKSGNPWSGLGAR